MRQGNVRKSVDLRPMAVVRGSRETPQAELNVASLPEPERIVAALAVADLHLSHKPPLARSCEEDWYNVQKGYLEQLRNIQREFDDCPILVAGDWFDRWNAPAETINFALAHLPDNLYGVSGQHDLPNHQYKDIRRSAYWTLVEAGKVNDLEHSGLAEVEGAVPLRLHGFPFGFPLKPNESPHDLCLEIAVVHRLVWSNSKNGYPGAPEKGLAGRVRRRLNGFDVAVFGDNHRGFLSVPGEGIGPVIVNCGTFMRRKSDERDYSPAVGLIWSDGSVTRRKLDVAADRFLEIPSVPDGRTVPDVSGFIEELGNLKDAVIDFEDALKRSLEGQPDGVQRAVLESLERARGQK